MGRVTPQPHRQGGAPPISTTRIDTSRTIGFLGATGIGVGAIVGGGILALAGVAFKAAGPSALLAFALNAVIAVITALSFAEMSTAFPQSGGTYTFAKKVLSVQAAFAVGWVVWFASMVAAALYALGFAAYGAIVVASAWRAWVGPVPPWVGTQAFETCLALVATGAYTAILARRVAAGGQWETVGKMVVFAVVILGGFVALAGSPPGTAAAGLDPFLSGGGAGVLAAMGYTFIAFQGFDLIAAVAGEVREPERVMPRSMLLSLALALVVYMPLLFLIATVGVPAGKTLAGLSAADPETVVAEAARHFMGLPGYWLVVTAAVLSMLSALQANLLAASRVALAMAVDRTLPRSLARISSSAHTPVMALAASAGTAGLLMVVLNDVAAAGAAASLIFLLTFALAHWTCILFRRRSGGRRAPFQVPGFPWLPGAGALACLGLACFQGVVEPRAGFITAVWLVLGGSLYLALFEQRARVVDAAAEASDPHLVRLRGRSPVVLVPIVNPQNAEAMVAVASALSTPEVGRVLLLSVAVVPEGADRSGTEGPVESARSVAGEALRQSFAAGLFPEALLTVAPQPWEEIARVVRTYRCECLLLGLTDLAGQATTRNLEGLLAGVDQDVVVLRSPPGWNLEEVRRVLVPVAGFGAHDALRARLLSSLCRAGPREIVYLGILPEQATEEDLQGTRRSLERLSSDEHPGASVVEAVRAAQVVEELVSQASRSDLVVLGLQRLGGKKQVFGEVILEVARRTSGALLVIGHQG